MATETAGDGSEGGLEIHPMDQFVVAPLFPATSDVASFDPVTGMAVLANGDGVLLTPEQLAEAAGGTEVSVNLFDAGLQQVGMFTVTNATLWMAITVACVYALLVLGTRGRAVVPSRTQSAAELAYGFVHKMVADVSGKEGLRYFPYIMTLFMFILFANVVGLVPASFAVTSHIAVTAVLALAVFLTVTILGFVKNGAGFLSLFWVSSAPLALRPILAVIELISYFVRPVSHSIRLAGNIMAGHAVLKVFAGFAGALGLFAFLPVLAITAVYALEVLVAFIQAYVFTILTCVYLKDALHPHH